MIPFSMQEMLLRMMSSTGTLALSFMAMAVLFAPAAAAQAPGIGQSFCQDWGGGRACESHYYPPTPSPPPPAPEPPVQHTTGSEATVHYDDAAEARKAQLRAIEHRVPSSSSLCPPPYRMTAQDGCQK